MKPLIIVGAGAHGRIVGEAAVSGGEWEVVAFEDDNPSRIGGRLDGVPVRTRTRKAEDGVARVIAIGHAELRRRFFEEYAQAGERLATIAHARAVVSTLATLGEGTVVLAGAVIQAGARIGANVILNAGAVVDHDAVVGDHAHVGLNSVVQSGAHVAIGEVLGPGTIRWRSAPGSNPGLSREGPPPA